MKKDYLAAGKTTRREYRTPQLSTYGAVRELTSSGTRGDNEQGNPGPGGQTDKMA